MVAMATIPPYGYDLSVHVEDSLVAGPFIAGLPNTVLAGHILLIPVCVPCVAPSHVRQRQALHHGLCLVCCHLTVHCAAPTVWCVNMLEGLSMSRVYMYVQCVSTPEWWCPCLAVLD